MDTSNNSLSQPTAMIMDTDMHNLYAVAQNERMNEGTSPVPVLGNLQSVMTTVNTNSPTQSTTASPTPQLKVQHDSSSQILTRPRLQDLVREVDPTEQLDEEVEEILLQLADDFVESTVNAACLLAKHRKSNTVDVKDVQLHLVPAPSQTGQVGLIANNLDLPQNEERQQLAEGSWVAVIYDDTWYPERNWNMWLPGFGTDELRPYKRSVVTEAHKQRLALIRKTLKKY